MVSNLPDAAIREPVTRSSGQLNDQLRQLLDKTPVGHLTPPSRTASGIEMIALCSRNASKDDSIVRKEISTRLLAAHLQSEANRRLADLRSHAVIVKP
jgi:peptidyl-prolyl cis-trans isomerase SurA